MKAAQISLYGDPSVIELRKTNKPSLAAGQVLVEVYAASLNPFDSAVLAGYTKDIMPLAFPTTLGGDIAGIVVEISDDVTGIAVGDKVYGQASVFGGNSGALAEFAATKSTQVSLAPGNVDFKQAASLVLVGVSAVQALTELIGLRPGQKIFIHGGSGGIGSIAIQIAKNIDAYVATTATGDNITLVKNLGADEVIDYKSQDFADLLKDYDAVFDTVGGDDFAKSLIVLRPGGMAISMVVKFDAAKANKLGIKTLQQSTQVTTERLNALTDLVEAGVITPRIGQIFPLDQTSQAFDARQSGKIQGKIVVEIKKL